MTTCGRPRISKNCGAMVDAVNDSSFELLTQLHSHFEKAYYSIYSAQPHIQDINCILQYLKWLAAGRGFARTTVNSFLSNSKNLKAGTIRWPTQTVWVRSTSVDATTSFQPWHNVVQELLFRTGLPCLCAKQSLIHRSSVSSRREAGALVRVG